MFVCLAADGPAALWLTPSESGRARELVDEVSMPVLGRTSQAAFPEYQGHIAWDYYYDWWQP